MKSRIIKDWVELLTSYCLRELPYATMCLQCIFLEGGDVNRVFITMAFVIVESG